MKYILLLLLLTSCLCKQAISAPDPSEQSPWAPTQIYTDSNGKIRWTCRQEEANDKLVWIVCSFKNQTLETQNVCINVIYYNKLSNNSLMVSRNVCSGPLVAYQVSENYAEFSKEKREVLKMYCGLLMDQCAMLVKEK